MTIVLACAIRARSSIQTGTPAAARGSIPLQRPARRLPIGDHLDINAAFLGAD
jgi:hypothetical protein